MFVVKLSCRSCGSHQVTFTEDNTTFCGSCGSRDTFTETIKIEGSTDWNQFKPDTNFYQSMIDVMDGQDTGKTYQH